MVEVIKDTKNTIKARCGHCPRVIFKTDETDKQFKKKDGKIICPVCRATKLSKFKKEIKADKKKYKKDKKQQETLSQKVARDEITDIAMASQDRVGDKYRRKNKK